MNITICEDEKVIAEGIIANLKQILADNELTADIAHYSNGKDFIKNINLLDSTDLIFMDIQLGDNDGVELMKEVRERGYKTTVIFLTGLEDRITEGYDVNAFHYLFKRNYQEKLPSVIKRFIKEVYKSHDIAVKHKGEVLLLKPSDIYYIDADKRNTSVHTANEIYTDNTSIQSFALLLPEDCFTEAYHALYVNIDHITRVNTDTLSLDNGETVPVSRRKRKELMSTIMKRIGNR